MSGAVRAGATPGHPRGPRAPRLPREQRLIAQPVRHITPAELDAVWRLLEANGATDVAEALGLDDPTTTTEKD